MYWHLFYEIFFLMLAFLQLSNGLKSLSDDVEIHQQNDESVLFQKLLESKRYNPKVRPVYNVSTVIRISIDIAVNQIIDFDEPRMVLKSETWMRVFWKDELLKWNASEFSGLTSFLIPAADVWLPDLTLYSSVVLHPNGVFGNKAVLVAVTCDGDMSWLFPTVIESRCGVDMSHFPFDTQRCEHEFGSWAYDGHKVDIHPRLDIGDTDNFMDNGEWEMVELPSWRRVKLYKCCDVPFPSVIYTYTLRRRPMYYMLNMVMPCFVITVVNLFSFLLPVESGEKITFNITTLLALVVFLRMVATHIPPQAGVVSIMEWYFGASILILCLSTVVGVFVYRIHFAGEEHKAFPVWARRIVNSRLATLLGCATSGQVQTDSSGGSKVIKVKAPDDRKSSFVDRGRVTPLGNQNHRATQTVQSDLHLDDEFMDLHNVRSTTNHHQQKLHSSSRDWQRLAHCVDKCFFVVFLTITVGISAYILSLLNI